MHLFSARGHIHTNTAIERLGVDMTAKYNDLKAEAGDLKHLVVRALAKDAVPNARRVSW